MGVLPCGRIGEAKTKGQDQRGQLRTEMYTSIMHTQKDYSLEHIVWLSA